MEEHPFFLKHPFRQVSILLFIHFVLGLNIRPPNSSIDLCLLLCLYSSSMLHSHCFTVHSHCSPGYSHCSYVIVHSHCSAAWSHTLLCCSLTLLCCSLTLLRCSLTLLRSSLPSLSRRLAMVLFLCLHLLSPARLPPSLPVISFSFSLSSLFTCSFYVYQNIYLFNQCSLFLIVSHDTLSSLNPPPPKKKITQV